MSPCHCQCHRDQDTVLQRKIHPDDLVDALKANIHGLIKLTHACILVVALMEMLQSWHPVVRMSSLHLRSVQSRNCRCK